jgi:RNA polymerase sigma factor (sigma-70 family)
LKYINEKELVEKLKQGDETAFKFIVEEYKDLVYNTAIGIVQNEEDAEDVAQEAFVQVYQSIHNFKGESKLSTWLYRITVTKALDHERKKKRKKRSAILKRIFLTEEDNEIETPDFNHPGVLLDQKENAAELFRAIRKLPENQKVAFVLNKLEGLSYQEISEVMNTSLSSVESLLHRAKTNLKKNLEDYYRKNL